MTLRRGTTRALFVVCGFGAAKVAGPGEAPLLGGADTATGNGLSFAEIKFNS